MTKATVTHSINTDPLTWAASEIRRMEVRRTEIEEMPQAIGTEKIFRDEEMQDLGDRVAILRDVISVIPATSLGGLLVQLDQAHRVADLNMGSDNDPDQAASDRRQFRRLIYSMKDCLRGLLPEGQSEKIEVLDSHLNPWHSYEARVAQVAVRAA